MQLLKRLDSIDRRRRSLDIYMTRWRRMFFMPKARKRMLHRLNARWIDLSRERKHVMDLIYANPEARTALVAREKQKLAVEPSASNEIPTQSLEEMAHAVLRLQAAERAAKSAYQDAVNYYKWGRYKADGIDVDRLGPVLDHFKATFLQQQTKRAELQHEFEKQVTAETLDPTQAILRREELLTKAERANLVTSQGPNDVIKRMERAFDRWLREETGRPAPETDQIEHPRRRRRDRDR